MSKKKKSRRAEPPFTAVSANDLAKSVVQITAIQGRVKDGGAAIPSGTARPVRVRHGAQQAVALLVQIAAQHDVELPGVDTEAMTELMTHGTRLRHLLGQLDELRALVKDDIARSEAASWEMAKATHAALRGVLRCAPGMRSSLTPVKRWFSHRSPRTIRHVNAHKRGSAARTNGSAVADS